MQEKNMAEPQCPKCGIKGIQYIVSKDSIETSDADQAWFNIAHCSECGHVYGVFNKIVHKQFINFDA